MHFDKRGYDWFTVILHEVRGNLVIGDGSGAYKFGNLTAVTGNLTLREETEFEKYSFPLLHHVDSLIVKAVRDRKKIVFNQLVVTNSIEIHDTQVEIEGIASTTLNHLSLKNLAHENPPLSLTSRRWRATWN